MALNLRPTSDDLPRLDAELRRIRAIAASGASGLSRKAQALNEAAMTRRLQRELGR